MKIIYMGVFTTETAKPVQLAGQHNVKSYNMFLRSNVSQFATFSGAIVAGRTRPGERQTITTKEVDDKPQEGAEVYNIHAYARSEGICGIIVSDLEYPERVAHAILSKILDGFASKYPRTAYANAQETTTLPYPELDELIKKYQNPEEADSVMKIQKELDETKNIMHKTLESVLERGEKMENLVQKSELLSSQSKMFYTQAKKQNSCCNVM